MGNYWHVKGAAETHVLEALRARRAQRLRRGRHWRGWLVCLVRGHQWYFTDDVPGQPQYACRRCPRQLLTITGSGLTIYPPPKA